MNRPREEHAAAARNCNQGVCLQVGAGYVVLSVFYVAFATLNGQGRPLVGAVAMLIGAWFVCVPLAYILSHPLHGVSKVLCVCVSSCT